MKVTKEVVSTRYIVEDEGTSYRVTHNLDNSEWAIKYKRTEQWIVHGPQGIHAHARLLDDTKKRHREIVEAVKASINSNT